MVGSINFFTGWGVSGTLYVDRGFCLVILLHRYCFTVPLDPEVAQKVSRHTVQISITLNIHIITKKYNLRLTYQFVVLLRLSVLSIQEALNSIEVSVVFHLYNSIEGRKCTNKVSILNMRAAQLLTYKLIVQDMPRYY